MPTCVYCRRIASEPFPAEHVIPRSLGLFRNGLTLHCVCGECNQFFGNQGSFNSAAKPERASFDSSMA